MADTRTRRSDKGAARWAVPAFVLGLALALPAAAQQAPQIGPKVFELTAGLFCAPAETGRRDAPDTISGWIHVPTDPVQMVAQGQVAVTRLNTGFGVTYRLQPGLFGRIRYSVTHPPIPPGNQTAQTWEGYLDPGLADTVFFQFDIPEELQPGLWTISAALMGETLFTVEFRVVPPETAPDLTTLCQAPSLLSRLGPAVIPTSPDARG